MANIKITWDDVAGADHYNLYYIETNDGDPAPILTPETGTAITGIMYTIYHHSGLIDGKRYYYIITGARKNGQIGLASDVTSALAETIIPEIVLTSIAISPTTISVDIGNTQQYAAIGTYSDSSIQDITDLVTWHSSRESIATIDGSGLATGISAGVEVEITGTNFVDGCTVWFGATEAISVTFNSSTSLTAIAPAHIAGAVDVTVINPDAQQDGYSSFTFE